MIYTHFTQHEIDLITGILDKHEVRYELLQNDQTAERDRPGINQDIIRGRYAGRNTFYDIVIEQEQLAKLPPDALNELERLNIIPEVTDVLTLHSL